VVYDKSAAPKIVVVTFIGGIGAIVRETYRDGVARFGPGANFLIRIRASLAAATIADAIIDAPSDRLPNGMTDDFRAAISMRPTCARSSPICTCGFRKRASSHRHEPRARSGGTPRGVACDVVQGAILSSR